MYSSSELGDIKTVNRLRRDDLIQAHRTSLNSDRVSIAIVGDIGEQEAVNMLEELLRDVPKSTKALPGRAKSSFNLGIKVIDYPSPQSVVFFTLQGIKRTDSSFFEAFIMNHILGGGGFNSRLMREIREKRGLTYSVSTSLANYDNADLYLGMFQSSNEKVSTAIDILKHELLNMAQEGVSDEELLGAKNYLIGAYPLRFDGNVRIAKILASMQFIGLNKDYIKSRNEKIKAIKSSDIALVANRLLSSKDFTIVIVGEPQGL